MSLQSDFDTAEKYNFPVFATQGGGLVREVGEVCIFVEAPPEGVGLTVGDIMPKEWGIVAANDAARRQLDDELWGD